MHNSKLTRLLTNFESANKLTEEHEFEHTDITDALVNDKIGRYYLIHNILFRWDEALKGKLESSPTKE